MIFESAYTFFFISINSLVLVTLRLSKVFLENLALSVLLRRFFTAVWAFL